MPPDVPPIKVAHLTSAHPPFDTRIFHKACKTLVAAGFDVVLVAQHDHDETRDGVRIRAVPSPTGRLSRMTRTVRAVYAAALAEDAALYHFHDPELIPVGLLLTLRGKRVVYDVHEDVPEDVLTKAYLPAPLRHAVSLAMRGLHWLAGRAFAGIVAVTPSIAAPFPPAKTRLVQNFPLLEELDAVAAAPYRDRAPLAAYVGVANEERGARELVAALGLLPAESPLRVAFAGTLRPAALEAELQARPGWARVDFHGWQGRPEVARLLGEARMGLVLFHPIANHVASQPNKLFEYMAAGLPVVASDFPRWRELIDGAGCGVLVDPLDPAAIARAMTWLLDHPEEAEAMGRRGAEAVQRRYHWGPEGQTLVDLTRKLTT